MKQLSFFAPVLIIGAVVTGLSIALGTGTHAVTSAHSTWAYGQMLSVPLR